GELLGLDRLELEVVDDGEAALFHLHREGGAHRAEAHLARGAIGVATDLGTVSHAAADEDRRRAGTVPRVTGLLLFVDLATRTRNGRTVLHRRRPCATRSELRLEDLVKERLVDLGSEDLLAELDLADVFALEVINFDLGHVFSRCFRRP